MVFVLKHADALHFEDPAHDWIELSKAGTAWPVKEESLTSQSSF